MPSTDQDAHLNLRRLHDENSGEGFPQNWDPAQELAQLNSAITPVQLLSNTDAWTAEEVMRSNSFGAAITTTNPARFGLLASLPMLDGPEALDEIDRALDELHADDFALRSSYDGHNLGDSIFNNVWRRLNERRATVFIHANPHLHNPTELPTPLLEVTFDIARTVYQMIYSGFFRNHRDIRLIVAQAGGLAPTLAGRVQSTLELDWAPNPMAVSKTEIREALAGLFYDVAVSGTFRSLGPVLEITTPDHVVYGCDTGAPCTDLPVVDLSARRVFTSGFMSGTAQESVATTAVSLFPQVAMRAADPLSAP
ncbi:amidohydrolase family protein [Amnibacterium kyonggiense]|uniref:6-methylsalicylate decarboxylase n=1 Tax=Amnibacterium kyonggiense TaxID=595671 RepID=A0A4R7FRN9_9MICO|nr:amidohydrolase family protein [Amnibacterium kyonggiense]TDS80319.1 putative TIM-barrel fold metal-dependent hydrolase [Amnibacterium kyonggiense]